MADCVNVIANDFVAQCEGYMPKKGTEEMYLYNINDVDYSSTTMTNKGTKVTALVLKTGKKIYKAGGNSKTNRANHALSIKDYGNGYIHTGGATILYKGEVEREAIQELVQGSRVGVIVKKRDGGLAGELKFEILGLESGMEITEDNWNTTENGGTTSITFATPEDEEESTGAKLWVETDLATTEAWITTNLYAR